MKKILYLSLILLTFQSCSTSKLSLKGKQEKDFVDQFLKLMKNSTEQDYLSMKDYISPQYIQTNSIDMKNIKVNRYSLNGYSINSYDKSTGLIATHIWGNGKSWTHEVIFKVVKEDNKLYLYPSKLSKEWLDPWFSVRTFIE